MLQSTGSQRVRRDLGTEQQREQMCRLWFLVCDSFKTPVNAEGIWQPISTYDFLSFHHT